MFVVLGLLLVVPLLKLMFFLVAGVGILLGVAVLAVALIPILIALLAVFAAITLMVLRLFGFRPWRLRGRSFRRWRGSF